MIPTCFFSGIGCIGVESVGYSLGSEGLVSSEWGSLVGLMVGSSGIGVDGMVGSNAAGPEWGEVVPGVVASGGTESAGTGRVPGCGIVEYVEAFGG